MSQLNIRPIRAEEAAEAKRLIYQVAHALMVPELSLEEVTALWDSWGVFNDLDDIQGAYDLNEGVFLVTVDGEKIGGTGAFWRDVETGVCEVKRVTITHEYRWQGAGDAMMAELTRRAPALGYRKMRLWTNRTKLARAVKFYLGLGFVEVQRDGTDKDGTWMEKSIDQPLAAPDGPG